MSPRSRWISLGWIAVGALGVAVIVVLGVGLRSERGAERWVSHTLEVEAELRALESDVNAMSGELRGYLLAHETGWLDTYHGRVDEGWREVTRIQDLTSDNPMQRKNVRLLRQRLQAVVDWGDQLTTATAHGKTDDTARLVGTGQGERAWDGTRNLIHEMWSEEENLLHEREAYASLLRRVGFALALISGALMAVQCLVTFGFVRARVRDLERQQDILRQGNDYAQAIVATVRQPLLVVDRDLRVVSANRSFYLLFGLSTLETEGVLLAELGGGPWNIPELLARLLRVLDDQEELHNFALEHAFPRLGRRHLLLNARKVFRPGNHMGLVLLAIEDDTDRARNQERLQQINAELEAFAYTIAHDLRAPLRGMQGFSEALLEDYRDKLDDTGKSYVQHISSAAKRMDELIRDLLEYSRLSRTEVRLESVSLDQVVSAARQQLGDTLSARHAEVEVPHSLPAVAGHFGILVQIVANLLDNGTKFVARGVTPKVAIRAERRSGRQRLWVEDNGIGIAPQFHQKIFRVFERLHAQDTYPGTGIGLAVVRKGVERLGGEVGVESALGQGSRFWIELPPDSA